MPTYLKLGDIADKKLTEGISGKMVHTDNMTIAHVHIKKGTKMPEHHHPHEQVSTVMKGELDFIIGGETRRCKPGDIIVIPGNEPHAVHAHTDSYVLDVFQPARDEYR